jgi:hypothetical protein
MPRPVTFNLVTNNGAVQSFDSGYLTGDDLPASGVTPGEYAMATFRVDSTGRITSVSPSTAHFAYTDVANVFTAIPQQIAPGLAGVQWQFGLGAADRDIRWVVDGDPTTYARLIAGVTKFGNVLMRFETVAAGVITASGTFGNGLFDLSSNLTTLQASGVIVTGVTTLTSDAAGNVPLKVNATGGQTANLVEVYDLSSVLVAFFNKEGSLKLNGQAGEYPIQVFTADGLTSIFRVSNLTGETQIAGEIGTMTGIRALAFGVYMGVSGAQRFVFNNNGIDAYDFNTTDNVLRLHGVASQSGEVFQIYGQSSTSDRAQAAIDTSWVDSTDATRKARVTIKAYDTAAREGFRVEASGSVAKVGFYGHAAAAQSAAYTPTNVTPDRSYDANATTIDELADVLGSLIADLQATGLIG